MIMKLKVLLLYALAASAANAQTKPQHMALERCEPTVLAHINNDVETDDTILAARSDQATECGLTVLDHAMVRGQITDQDRYLASLYFRAASILQNRRRPAKPQPPAGIQYAKVNS